MDITEQTELFAKTASEICAAVELDPAEVWKIVWSPYQLEVYVWLADEHGDRFLDGDGQAAFQIIRFPGVPLS